jgi:hypothetical protein
MFKKISFILALMLLLGQVFSGFSFAQDKDLPNDIQSKLVLDVNQILNNSTFRISRSQLNSALAAYSRQRNSRWDMENISIYLRDYTGDGKPEIVIISSTYTGQKYIDIFSVTFNRISQIFSGRGKYINLYKNSFSISNVGYDGRYYYETYTYKWHNGRFLRTGYAKTYTRDIDFEKPIKKDERIVVVDALLKARMKGNYKEVTNYLSKEYKNKIKPEQLSKLIPYGRVTAIEIFDSRNGDWVVVVIRDTWGRSRVFKFVPVQEKDQYGNFKVDYIMEIPKAN